MRRHTILEDLAFVRVMLIGAAFLVLVGAVSCLLPGCSDVFARPQGCTPTRLRCGEGNVVQVCDSRTVWSTRIRCGEVEPREQEWTCCELPGEGPTCAPRTECEERNGTHPQ